MKITKGILISAILGETVPSMYSNTNTKLTPYCGRNGEPDWRWDRKEMNKLEYEVLESFYKERDFDMIIEEYIKLN